MNFKCILCGENGAITLNKKVRDSSDHEVVKCSSCGHFQLYPMPTVFEDEDYYNEDLQNKSTHSETNIDINDIKQKSDWDTKRRFEQVSGYADKNTRILEIGSGYGFFIEYMEQNCFKIKGLEVSKSRRQYSETKCKSEIYSLNLIKDNVPEDMLGRFEVIVMFQVLEHITDPVTFMMKVKSMLSPDGKLIIEVPNAGDHLLSFCEAYSKFFWQRAHVSYFYTDTLK
jgi:2-polyprenyl-3-methyl-5-hydroxy-6-metoxy-1,4-benzoquinol methylase